jgi:hypothetical protein
MRQQDSIDRGKVFDPHSRQTKPVNQNQPVCEDRINEKVQSAYLQQKRCMADERNRQFARRYEHRLLLHALRGLKGRAANKVQGKPQTRLPRRS